MSARSRATFKILCPDGQIFAGGLSPEGFCDALRKIVESTTDSAELRVWLERNAGQVARLRAFAPDFKTARDEHYADVLERLIGARLADREPKSGPSNGNGTCSPSAPVRQI